MQSKEERKKIPSWVLYVLVVLLLGFYICVLITGLQYDGTTEGYRAYYIDQILNRYVPDHIWAEEYTVNREISFLNEENVKAVGYGWNEVGEEGSWMENPAGFYIFLSEISEEEYILLIRKTFDEGCQKRLQVNGKDLGNVDFEPEEVRILIPAALLVKGLNRFELTGKAEDEDYPPAVKSIGVWDNK